MGKIKSAYWNELMRRQAIEDGHCGQCGEDADLQTEAWKYGLCKKCFDETNNGITGVGV